MPSITDVKGKSLAEGLVGHYVHGEQAMLGLVLIAKGSILPLHHHVHEQITYIIEGELEMTIGNETMVLSPGSYYVIPSNVPHSAIAHSDCKVIDVFSPVREEYKVSDW